MTDSTDPVADEVDLAALRKLGVFNHQGFQQRRRTSQDDFLIPNFLRRRSRNLVVGDSGLGKTPFTVGMAIHLAAGIPWLNQGGIQPACVLYCDGESGEGLFSDMALRLAQYAGLEGVPANFFMWNPMWSTTPPSSTPIDGQLSQIVTLLRPDVVFVDPLRVFFPHGDGDGSAALLATTNKLISLTRCAWVFIHHLRKRGKEPRPSLADDTHAFFQESCGALALVNHTDVRLGIDASTKGEADLCLAGFLRGVGKVGPFHLAREYGDDDGEPQGYRMLSGVEHLPSTYKIAYQGLSDQFRFKEVKNALGGKSASNANAMIQEALNLRLIEKLKNGLYQKVGVHI